MDPFDAQLVRKLGKSGPRYTPYPAAERFNAAFGYLDYLEAVVNLRTRGGAKAPSPLSATLR